MIAMRFARQFGLERRSNSFHYWLDGHAQNDRKAPASSPAVQTCTKLSVSQLPTHRCIGIILHEVSGLEQRLAADAVAPQDAAQTR